MAYHSDETYAVDKERVFYRNWVYVGRAERVGKPGTWLRVEIADESILVVRGKDDEIRAFYNVCRHRGSRICDDEQGEVRTHLRCPYHAWGYALDGSLVTTPMIEKDEIDRESTSLWPVHVDVWEGFVFVNLSREDPRAAARCTGRPAGQAARAGPGRARRAARSATSPRWTCGQLEDRPRELQRVPALPDRAPRAGGRRAGVPQGQHLREPGREDGGVTLADGRTSVALDPRLRLPLLPGLKGQTGPAAYFGAAIYPTMFLDVDGSAALATAVFPTGPRSCRLVTEYLFSPEAFEDPEFDPKPVIEFNELVTRQDNDACERVQRGVTSRAFEHGVFPAKDSWVYSFDQRYLRDVEQ